MADRNARRRRIISGGQDRLALITGRKPHLSYDTDDPDSSQPFITSPPNQPSALQYEEDKPSDTTFSTREETAKLDQNEPLITQTSEELFVRKPEPRTEPSRAPATENTQRGESSSTVPKAVLIASEAVLRVAQKIPIGHLTSQQVSVAVSETEHDRMSCALTFAILVVLSSAGFPIVSSFLFRWIILFKPLFLVLIANTTLIVRRLLPENHRNSTRGVKDDGNETLLGDGYAWAVEAGRALELGLMLQNVVGALVMDFTIYATIVVFGLSLFG